MEYCMTLTTCPNTKEAQCLAEKLVEEKLAACVQLSDIQSYYVWKNQACAEPEVRLTIKTRAQLYPLVAEFIKKQHRYEVPQMIQVPVTNGSAEFLEWIRQNTSSAME